MDDIHVRAMNNLGVLTDYLDALVNGAKQQLDDAEEVTKKALDPENYSASEWIADMTALWINGASIPFRAIMGEPGDDEEP